MQNIVRFTQEMKIRAKRMQGLWKSTKGLLGKKKAEPLLISTRFGIHTFGLKFAIDVIIVDANNRIVALKKNLVKNKIFFWNPWHSTVLELPGGFIEKQKLALGQKITIEVI